jgi:hypothetical protein
MNHNGVFCLILSLSSGCAASSQYLRADATPHEIVWAFDGGLAARQDGAEIGGDARWGDLPEAVRCVPEAVHYADGARSRATAGHVLEWSGVAMMAGGLGGGLAMGFGQQWSDQGTLTAVGVIGGGLLAGLGVWLAGYLDAHASNAQAIDAVNVYNDALLAGVCKGLPTRLASVDPSSR